MTAPLARCTQGMVPERYLCELRFVATPPLQNHAVCRRLKNVMSLAPASARATSHQPPTGAFSFPYAPAATVQAREALASNHGSELLHVGAAPSYLRVGRD